MKNLTDSELSILLDLVDGVSHSLIKCIHQAMELPGEFSLINKSGVYHVIEKHLVSDVGNYIELVDEDFSETVRYFVYSTGGEYSEFVLGIFRSVNISEFCMDKPKFSHKGDQSCQ